MRRPALLLAFSLGVLPLATAARAVEPDEILRDPALESRARDISHGLRCLVCQNQSIDDSDAPLAKDLRTLVRRRLEAGDTDAQVVDYLVSRYGEFVLLKPRFEWHTLALWGAPVILITGGMLYALASSRRRNERTETGDRPLSAAEEGELDELLRRDG